jgi:pimeloyl-ACP methyl ester carboxylesterase
MKKILRIVLVLCLLAIVLTVGVIFLRPNLIISKSEAKKQLSTPYSHFINWRGAELHYTDEGSGFPVLMIHGFGGSLRNFDSLALLLKKDYRVVRVDVPGFGLSDFPSISEHENFIQDYSNYLTFMLDTLHLDSVYVIGNSMGGGLTWLMAGDHPEKVKKIVLLDPAGYDTKNVASKLSMFKYKSFAHVFDRGMPLFMSRSGALKSYCRDQLINPATVEMNNRFSNREGNITFMLTLARAQQFPDTALIARVQCPTLIVWGKEDEIIPLAHAADFHRDIKNSTVCLLDSCGHCPMMEQPKETEAVVRKFFSE